MPITLKIRPLDRRFRTSVYRVASRKGKLRNGEKVCLGKPVEKEGKFNYAVYKVNDANAVVGNLGSITTDDGDLSGEENKSQKLNELDESVWNELKGSMASQEGSQRSSPASQEGSQRSSPASQEGSPPEEAPQRSAQASSQRSFEKDSLTDSEDETDGSPTAKDMQWLENSDALESPKTKKAPLLRAKPKSLKFKIQQKNIPVYT